jgi:hypothetical protein
MNCEASEPVHDSAYLGWTAAMGFEGAGVSPAMMTAPLLYAYTQSSRRIARACEDRLDFHAVTAGAKPDFRTRRVACPRATRAGEPAL